MAQKLARAGNFWAIFLGGLFNLVLILFDLVAHLVAHIVAHLVAHFVAHLVAHIVAHAVAPQNYGPKTAGTRQIWGSILH